jgi:hypothetical protein
MVLPAVNLSGALVALWELLALPVTAVKAPTAVTEQQMDLM